MVINNEELNAGQLNHFDVTSRPCPGVTLSQFRQRLRNELSGYAANTLISSDTSNDVERQFINDGISVLWPHDYQVVMHSVKVEEVTSGRFFLPTDCEHVFSVFQGDADINNDSIRLTALPHHEYWMFDRAFIEPVLALNPPSDPWAGGMGTSTKAIWVKGTCHSPYLVARYARKWPALLDDGDCIDPSTNRVLAVVFYACYSYFASQMQVNTESIRYRNYQAIAQQFYQYYQQQLIKDSKPLYIV